MYWLEAKYVEASPWECGGPERPCGSRVTKSLISLARLPSVESWEMSTGPVLGPTAAAKAREGQSMAAKVVSSSPKPLSYLSVSVVRLTTVAAE